jgi:aerobic-type carbon monoxide dehydrogenase small subunit (CoxS/CutS family)
MRLSLSVNGATREVEADPETPLLWVLREKLRLTGTKFGCGIAQCGACSVHIDGQLAKSCSVTAASVVGRKVTTIEGVSPDSSHAVQRAWVEESVPQCGYCQSGQIMAALALLQRSPDPSDREIDEAMAGNLCRCGTYTQIRRGIHRAAKLTKA